MLIAGPGDVAARDLARSERCVDLDAKPFSKFAMIGKGAPDAIDGRGDVDLFFDAVRHDVQPPSCILTQFGDYATILLHVIDWCRLRLTRPQYRRRFFLGRAGF